MPIKFRCQHCKQFLGISHIKAGLLVDCPTCGRTIRVPDPEGYVEPLPEPKLNLLDSRLKIALEELANMGLSDAEFEPESAVAVAEGEGTTPKTPTATAAPPPAPVPIRLEPPLPAMSIPLEVHDPYKPSPIATMQELAALANRPLARDPAAEQPSIEASPFANGNRYGAALPTGRRSIALSWVVSIAMVTFGLGFVAGRWDRSPKAFNPPANAPLKNVPVANGNPKVVKEPSVSNTNEPAVRGRITFKNAAGERRADRGARVLLLPEKRDGSTKLSVVGFRSADAEADVQVASAGLKALGGDVAIVDESGNFEIASLKSGTYRVLALSHFQPRDMRESLDASLKGILENFFDRPEQLLGKCGYHFGEIKLTGQETELWDHSFERD